jgi:Sigma-70, region 4
MSSPASLPADQRAVLELVLKQGRGYDDIARLLSVSRAAVRERALAAFDAIGPQTRVPRERRALITDYLLGQLPPRVADDTRQHLAQSASERAWARVLASELAPLSRHPLPEIPADAAGPEPVGAAPGASTTPRPAAPRTPVEPVKPAAVADRPPQPIGAQALGPAPPSSARDGDDRGPGGVAARPSSRRGGIILLSLGALVVAGVVVAIILITGGSSSNSSTSTAAVQPAATTATTTPAPGATTSTTSTSGAHLVAQINLKSPSKSSKAAGVALVLKQGKNTGIAIRAQKLPANGKHDAYAVWLYKSAQDSQILGFVNPSVGSNGVLQAESGLPANAGHFTQLLITKETRQKPSSPGSIVLKGQLKGL